MPRLGFSREGRAHSGGVTEASLLATKAGGGRWGGRLNDPKLARAGRAEGKA